MIINAQAISFASNENLILMQKFQDVLAGEMSEKPQTIAFDRLVKLQPQLL